MKPSTLALLALFVFAILTLFGWRSNKSFGEKSADRSLIADLQKHVYHLSHEIGNRNFKDFQNLQNACDYIVKTFASFGYTIELQKYQIEGKIFNNIIVTKLGKMKPNEQIIVGAHYDTFFNPGADDNASGIACLLELAKSIAGKDVSETVIFVAFVNEEPPFFKTQNMGSKVYVDALRLKKATIKVAIIFEMLGFYSEESFSQRYPPFFGAFYPNKANFIVAVNNFQSRSAVKKIVTEFKKASDFPIEMATGFGFVPGLDFSDHWSFWQAGYPAVMITDTAFYRNKYYHRETDTYEKLNYANMAEIVRAFAMVLENY